MAGVGYMEKARVITRQFSGYTLLGTETLMHSEEALSNLKSRLEYHIAAFSQRRKRDKAKAFRYKIITLALTLIATLALGIEWSTTLSSMAKQIAFVATALVSFLTGLDLYFNHKGLWVQFTITRNELYKINDDLEYQVEKLGADNLEDNQLDDYHRRIQKALDDCNSWWVGERTKHDT